MADDLGSWEKIKSARALVWYPSEVDVSIRPGWFYHAEQDDRVKTPQKLVDIYFSSVGRNSVLLLNLPPDKRGLIHENDVASLKGMRAILDRTFARDLVAGATATSTSASSAHPPSLAVDGDDRTYWTAAEGVSSATLDVTLPSARSFDRALLQEYIREGQRVERFHVDAWDGSAWRRLADGTTIGYKRLLRFPAVTASKVRLVIDESRLNPTISTFGLYKGPARVTIQPDGGGFEDSLAVRLDADVRGAAIHYTLDGTTPTVRSPRYDGPIVIRESGTLRATPVLAGEEGLEYSQARFTKRFEVKQVTFGTPYSPRYAGHGDATVADGHRATAAFDDGRWLGFESDDMVATLDLGRVRPIASVTAGFLQQQGSWIFLPVRVACSVSADGTTWTRLPEMTFPESRSAEVSVSDCAFTAGGIDVRYVRIEARNVGTCPPWHDGAGGKAWLFVDEIIVE
jgi:alpha-L-fucosidase